MTGTAGVPGSSSFESDSDTEDTGSNISDLSTLGDLVFLRDVSPEPTERRKLDLSFGGQLVAPSPS